MASAPSASALTSVLRCRGNLLARKQANGKRPPAGSGYSLGLKCGAVADVGAPEAGRDWGVELHRTFSAWSAFVRKRSGISVRVKGDAGPPGHGLPQSLLPALRRGSRPNADAVKGGRAPRSPPEKRLSERLDLAARSALRSVSARIRRSLNGDAETAVPWGGWSALRDRCRAAARSGGRPGASEAGVWRGDAAVLLDPKAPFRGDVPAEMLRVRTVEPLPT
ncbi:hypothetical protein GN956_G10210 [Arapaima gigas]